jgi:peptidoglycan/xylan/chitin deacetylase (PgdA/CDA1 family)
MRSLLKLFSYLLSSSVFRGDDPDIIVLMYHRVTGDVPLELDVHFDDFRRQMHWLAVHHKVISLDDAFNILRDKKNGATFDRPYFVITFDDAYSDFYTHAFPLLHELKIPSTVYVSTRFIEEPSIPPISRTIEHPEKLTPVTWSMLEELAQSPLITIGGHTHTHTELPDLDEEAIEDDLYRCDSLLKKRLGTTVHHFAYPRGVWDDRVRNIISQHYRTAALANGGGVRKKSFDPLCLPRVPVLRSDGMGWFRQRIACRLIHEEEIVRKIKTILSRLKSL